MSLQALNHCFLVCTAKVEELQGLLDFFNNAPESPSVLGPLHIHDVGDVYYVKLAEGHSFTLLSGPRQGRQGFAAFFGHAISVLRPKYAMMVGICAASEGCAELGEALIAEAAWIEGEGKVCTRCRRLWTALTLLLLRTRRMEPKSLPTCPSVLIPISSI